MYSSKLINIFIYLLSNPFLFNFLIAILFLRTSISLNNTLSICSFNLVVIFISYNISFISSFTKLTELTNESLPLIFISRFSIMFLIQYKMQSNSKGVPEGSPFEVSYLVIPIAGNDYIMMPVSTVSSKPWSFSAWMIFCLCSVPKASMVTFSSTLWFRSTLTN